MPETNQVEVAPSIPKQEVPTPVESPNTAPAPIAAAPDPSRDAIRPGPPPQAADHPGKTTDGPGGTRFAVTAPATGGTGLTYPAARGGATSSIGIGSGSGTGGGEANGSRSTLSRPQGRSQILPRYPETARRQGIQGITELKIHILSDGSVGEALVTRSAGHPDLDQAALEAVKTWRFEPARRGQEPVAVWALVPIRFRLD